MINYTVGPLTCYVNWVLSLVKLKYFMDIVDVTLIGYIALRG